jgi:hypothetical protein
MQKHKLKGKKQKIHYIDEKLSLLGCGAVEWLG